MLLSQPGTDTASLNWAGKVDAEAWQNDFISGFAHGAYHEKPFERLFGYTAYFLQALISLRRFGKM